MPRIECPLGIALQTLGQDIVPERSLQVAFAFDISCFVP